MRGIGAEIELVMALRDIERLRQSSWPGTKSPDIFDAATLAHQCNAAPRLERADENKPIAWTTFDKHVQHPVHAVVEVDIGSAWLVAPNELTRTWTAKGVARFVAFDQICLGFNDNPGTSFPHQLSPNEIFRADKRIGLEK